MKKHSGFVEFLDEVFEEFGQIDVPKMIKLSIYINDIPGSVKKFQLSIK